MAGGPIRLPIVSNFDDRGIRSAEAALRDFGKNTALVLSAATSAVVGFGAASVKAFADFDAEMQKSIAIMGDVSDTMRQDMAMAAREVAKTTTFSAEQAAESFYFLASAGLSATDSINALPAVANFAQAGMFDMATATSLLADAQSALGLRSADATQNLENLTRVSDVLVKANILANASTQEFSEALTNKAAASMKALGIELEEGVAVLATFAAQGIKGSEAGTMFNATLRGLTQGVQRNAGEFKRLNIEVFDSEGNMNNLADIVADMEGALAGMSVEQQRATLTQLGFTEETLAGTLALLGNSEAIRNYEKDLRNAGGTTDEVANKQLQTFNAQLDLMKSRFTDVMLSIGEGLTPTLITFVEQLGPILDELGPALIAMFEELGPVIIGIAEQLPSFIESLIPLIPVVGDLARLVLAIAEAIMPVLQEAIEFITPILDGFTGLLAENGEMFGALILAAALFIGTLRVLTGVLAITGGTSVAAGVASKGFFGILASGLGVVTAVFSGLIALSYWLMTVGRTTTDLNPIFRGFLEGIALLVAGTSHLIGSITVSMVGQLQGLLNAAVKGVEMAYNAVARAFKQKTITLTPIQLTMPKVLGLDEVRRSMGLLRDEIATTFTPKNTQPAYFASGFEERRFGVEGGARATFPGMVSGPMDIFGRTPFTPGFIAGQQFQMDQGINGFYGLGSSIGADQRAYNITVNAGLGTDPTQLGDEIYNILLQYDRYAAPVFQSARQ